ncbi:hypothetical protein OROGR_027997 [Orobanche gracilis]
MFLSGSTYRNKMKWNHMSFDKNKLVDLKILGNQLLINPAAHTNNVPILLSVIKPDSPTQNTIESLLALQFFFTPHLHQISSSTPPEDSDPKIAFFSWLRSAFNKYVHSLIKIAVSSKPENRLRQVVVDVLMEIMKEGGNAGHFYYPAIYHKLVHAVVNSSLRSDDILLGFLAKEFFRYIDIRYFTYISIEKLARTLVEKENKNYPTDADGENQLRPSSEHSVLKLHNLLSHISRLEASGDTLVHEIWTGSGVFFEIGSGRDQIDLEARHVKSNDKVMSSQNIAKKMKSKFIRAWITFVRLPLPLNVHNEVLATLHKDVIPHLSNPEMLSGFLAKSVGTGGFVSVMTLNTIYYLMTQHGLVYPDFYDKLCAVLVPSIFMGNDCTMLFQLLDSCLVSSLLPANVAAAFCKKLSELALCIPPCDAQVIFALVHNLRQRYTSVNCLPHLERCAGATKETCEGENESSQNPEGSIVNRNSFYQPGIDTLKSEDSDPKEPNALEIRCSGHGGNHPSK